MKRVLGHGAKCDCCEGCELCCPVEPTVDESEAEVSPEAGERKKK